MGNLAPGVADHGDVDTNDDFAEKHADFRRRGIEVEFTVGGLLKYVGAVHLKAVKRFVVADNFKKGNVVGSREIVWIGESFQFHYGDVVEVDVSPRIVFVWELFKRSLDEPVITILGGESDPKTEIHLAHQFQMMELGKQAHARLDGYANFGYKRSPKDGKLWVPDWDVDGEGLWFRDPEGFLINLRVAAPAPTAKDRPCLLFYRPSYIYPQKKALHLNGSAFRRQKA